MKTNSRSTKDDRTREEILKEMDRETEKQIDCYKNYLSHLDMKPEIIAYKINRSKKADLSYPTYAFHGNSQGDTSATNDVQDFLTSKGWMGVHHKYAHIEYLNQERVNERFKELEEIRLRELSELTDEDDEYVMELSIVANPKLDNNSYKSSLQSGSFGFIDLSKN